MLLQNGAVALSSLPNHAAGGNQSLAITTTGSGQRNIYLQRSLGGLSKGIATIYFYDSGPGFYAGIDLINSTTGSYADIGTQDFDAACYRAFVVMPDSSVAGPNSQCGPFPGVETTGVLRTIGWHKLRITSTGQDLNTIRLLSTSRCGVVPPRTQRSRILLSSVDRSIGLARCRIGQAVFSKACAVDSA